MGNPRVLLMDEPSEGLAPQIVHEVMNTIRKLKESGLSIVLVEQNPTLVFDVADDIVILNTGRVAMVSTPPRSNRTTKRCGSTWGCSRAVIHTVDGRACPGHPRSRCADYWITAQSRMTTIERQREMTEVWNKYADTAARKHGKPGREVQAENDDHRHALPCRGAACDGDRHAASQAIHRSAGSKIDPRDAGPDGKTGGRHRLAHQHDRRALRLYGRDGRRHAAHLSGAAANLL